MNIMGCVAVPQIVMSEHGITGKFLFSPVSLRSFFISSSSMMLPFSS